MAPVFVERERERARERERERERESGIAQQGGEECMVHAVAGALAGDVADNRGAGEVEVAEAVERLVPPALVRIAQPVLVEEAVLPHDHGVLQGPAAAHAGGQDVLHVLLAAEGSRPRELGAKAGARRNEHDRLITKLGMVEVDIAAEGEALRRERTARQSRHIR